MSGHSKWATIKRAKGAADAKRGQAFTKLSMAITLAVKQGGGVADPAGNARLRLAVEAARAANMPKDNIERAIQRAAGTQAQSVEEVVYEGFGPGGFSIIVEAITDKKQRTTPEVKNIFEKNGGSMGVPGSVSYQFKKTGEIIVNKKSPDESIDELFLIAAEAGADDVKDTGEEALVYTNPEAVQGVKDAIMNAGFHIISAEISQTPAIVTEISDPEAAKKALQFVEKLESMDDVQKVYVNFDIPESLMQDIPM